MVTPPWHNADFYLFVFNLFVFCCRFPTFLSRHKYTIKSEKQANPSESVKNKIGRNSLSYTLFFYPWLSLFTDAYFTSSKSIHYIYQRLAWTCCKYHANPKISIHKQPQLYVAKVRFFAENNERKTRKISILKDNLKLHH